MCFLRRVSCCVRGQLSPSVSRWLRCCPGPSSCHGRRHSHTPRRCSPSPCLVTRALLPAVNLSSVGTGWPLPPRHGIGLLVRTAAASGVSCRLWSATHRHSSIVRIVCTIPTLFFSVRYAYFLPYVTYVKPTLYCSTKQFKLQPDTVVGTARMRSRVYETVRCPSVRPSVCPIMGPQPQTRWCRLVCCCGPDGQKMSIDTYRMLSLFVI